MRNIFYNVKKLYSIAIYSVRLRITSSRSVFIFVLLAIFLLEKYSPIITVVKETGIKTNPLIFPFLSNDELLQKIIYSGVVFLFSDAPFINSTQPYVIMRSKRITWVLGQTFHIIIFSAFFFFSLMALSVIILLPNASFNTDGWGTLVRTLSQTSAGIDAGMDFLAYEKIIFYYSPIEAFCLCFLLNWGVMTFIGMLIFVINLLSNRFLGPVVAAIVVAFDLFVYNALPFYYYHFSPLSLTRLSALDPTGISDYPTLEYAFTVCAISIAALSVISTILIKNKSIEVNTEL